MLAVSSRVLGAEIMDQPGLERDQHLRALAGLRRINRLSGTSRLLWKSVSECARRKQLKRARLLDFACGGGDIALQLAERARRANFELIVRGWDKSETAIEHARQQATTGGYSTASFLVRDAIYDSIEEPYDFVISTLFLHHLSCDDALRLMRRMAETAQQAVFLDDLLRSRWGYVLAWTGCRLLSRSPIVHVDGPMSVKAAFREEEIRRMATEAGMADAVISRHWPQRFLLSWVRP